MAGTKSFDEYFKAWQESFTGYLAQISSDHAYVHKGLAFTAVLDIGSISSTYNIGFTTPTVASGKYIHWRPIGLSSSANYVAFKLYEGDTYTGGTAVTPVNRRREAPIPTTNMQSFATGVTSTPTGTVIQAGGLGSDGNPNARSGGGSAADQEILLARNETYVLQLEPSGSTSVVLELFWYEEGGV